MNLHKLATPPIDKAVDSMTVLIYNGERVKIREVSSYKLLVTSDVQQVEDRETWS